MLGECNRLGDDSAAHAATAVGTGSPSLAPPASFHVASVAIENAVGTASPRLAPPRSPSPHDLLRHTHAFLRRMVAAGADLIYPPICTLCRREGLESRSEGLCADCTAELTLQPRLETTTRHGAMPCWTLLTYEGRTREAIGRWKRGGDLILGAALCQTFARHTPPWLHGEIVVPVPGHPARRRQRGFEPAALLASALAPGRGRLVPSALHRTPRSLPQSELDRGQRLVNARHAFAATTPKRFTGRRVLLVDDVRTTGASLEICAQRLREAGAATVLLAALAQTP